VIVATITPRGTTVAPVLRLPTNLAVVAGPLWLPMLMPTCAADPALLVVLVRGAPPESRRPATDLTAGHRRPGRSPCPVTWPIDPSPRPACPRARTPRPRAGGMLA
jgi:hypothetical protein